MVTKLYGRSTESKSNRSRLRRCVAAIWLPWPVTPIQRTRPCSRASTAAPRAPPAPPSETGARAAPPNITRLLWWPVRPNSACSMGTRPPEAPRAESEGTADRGRRRPGSVGRGLLPGPGRYPEHMEHHRLQGFAQFLVGQVHQVGQAVGDEEHGAGREPLGAGRVIAVKQGEATLAQRR